MFKSEAYLPLGARKGKAATCIARNLQKSSKIFKNLQKPSKTFKNLQKPSKTFKNLQNGFKNLQNGFKNLQSGFKNLQIWLKNCSWIVLNRSEFWLRSILSSWRGPSMFSAWVDRSAEKRLVSSLFHCKNVWQKDICCLRLSVFLCILLCPEDSVFKLGPKTIHHLLSGLQKEMQLILYHRLKKMKGIISELLSC